ncbi:MAG TPA: hypothetical protein PK373_07885 [Sedimentisphaerales bacterium]|nr:hypothetical protein [Sedimentisphaerales bacterium]
MTMSILLPLLVGGNDLTPQRHHPRIEDCPFPVDPNLVEGRLLGWVRVELGKELIHTRTWYDPNGDLAKVEIVRGPDGVKLVNKPKTASYTIFWTPRQVMTTAIVVRVTDDPRSGKPMSDTGTILVQVVPRGQRVAPKAKGCGGPP